MLMNRHAFHMREQICQRLTGGGSERSWRDGGFTAAADAKKSVVAGLSLYSLTGNGAQVVNQHLFRLVRRKGQVRSVAVINDVGLSGVVVLGDTKLSVRPLGLNSGVSVRGNARLCSGGSGGHISFLQLVSA